MKTIPEDTIGSLGLAARLRISVPLVCALLLGGCSTTSSYKLKVQSVNEPDAKPTVSYRIETRNPEIDTNSLRYKEAERMMKTALSGKGLYEAPKPELADVVIELDYGMDAPVLSHETVSKPIFDSSRGYLGDESYPVTVTYYPKHLHVVAHENKSDSDGRPGKTVWGVEVKGEDESKDLRKYLPVMIGASIDYIGKDTGEVKTIDISGQDPVIDFVRQGL